MTQPGQQVQRKNNPTAIGVVISVSNNPVTGENICRVDWGGSVLNVPHLSGADGERDAARSLDAAEVGLEGVELGLEGDVLAVEAHGLGEGNAAWQAVDAVHDRQQQVVEEELQRAEQERELQRDRLREDDKVKRGDLQIQALSRGSRPQSGKFSPWPPAALILRPSGSVPRGVVPGTKYTLGCAGPTGCTVNAVSTNSFCAF
jgi:hypothetical protein